MESRTKTEKSEKKESKRAGNAFKIHCQPFYSSPYRRSIPSILILLHLGHIGTLICGAFWLNFALSDIGYYDSPYWHPYGTGSTSLRRFRAVSKWLFIPLLEVSLSSADLWCRWRRTLEPKRAVITASIGFLGWCLYIGLGFINGAFDISFTVFSSPGVVGCVVYGVLSIFALKRVKREMMEKEEGSGGSRGEVELRGVGEERWSAGRIRGGGEEDPSAHRRSSNVVSSASSWSTPSEPLPAYSPGLYHHHHQEDIEPYAGWRGARVESTRAVNGLEMPAESAEREEGYSFTGSSIRAGSSRLPAYSSSFSGSLTSEDLRAVDGREDRLSWDALSR